MSHRAPPGTVSRTSSRSSRDRSVAVLVARDRAARPRGLDRRRARRSLVRQVRIPEPFGRSLPVVFRDRFEQQTPQSPNVAGHDHDGIAEVEVPDVTTVVEPPTTPCSRREAHLASRGHSQISGSCHGGILQGDSQPPPCTHSSPHTLTGREMGPRGLGPRSQVSRIGGLSSSSARFGNRRTVVPTAISPSRRATAAPMQ